MIRFLSTAEEGGLKFRDLPLRVEISNYEDVEEALTMELRYNKPDVQTLPNMVNGICPGTVPEDQFGDSMLVVTTNKGENGAIGLFHPLVMDVVHKYLGIFYAIPCSVHEWICIPKVEGTADYLKETIKQINNAVLNPTDILSYDLFEYDPAKDALKVAE